MKKRIFEYDIIQTQTSHEMRDQMNIAISMNPQCQPYGNLVVTFHEGIEMYTQVIVYEVDQ